MNRILKDPSRRCTAKSKSTGQQCGNPAMVGAKTCRFHGSATKRSKAKAAREVETRAAAAAVVTFGLPRVVDPAAALLEEIHRTAGHVAWLEAKIRDLGDHDLVWGMTRIKEGGDDRGTTYQAGPNVWLQLYQGERKHLVDVCTAALKAGVEKRRVELAEAQGEQLALVIRAVLDDLGLTPAQQTLVGEVVPRHLRALGDTA